MEIKQVPFDPYGAFFTGSELALLSGLNRPMVDVWVNRGLLEPARRERPTTTSKKGRNRKGQGKPMYSLADVFMVRLTRELGAHLEFGLSEWVALASIAKAAKIASGENWMWAAGRAIENNKPWKIYGYATYAEGEWLFDMHINEFKEPCFGLKASFLFIPMSEVFEATYTECKKLLGIVTTPSDAEV